MTPPKILKVLALSGFFLVAAASGCATAKPPPPPSRDDHLTEFLQNIESAGQMNISDQVREKENQLKKDGKK